MLSSLCQLHPKQTSIEQGNITYCSSYWSKNYPLLVHEHHTYSTSSRTYIDNAIIKQNVKPDTLNSGNRYSLRYPKAKKSMAKLELGFSLGQFFSRIPSRRFYLCQDFEHKRTVMKMPIIAVRKHATANSDILKIRVGTILPSPSCNLAYAMHIVCNMQVSPTSREGE